VKYLKGEGGNIGMLAGPDGVFLVDDQYAPLTEKIVAAIRTVSDQPIRVVINTHMHPDHTGGNENLGRMGVMTVGHHNVRAKMIELGYREVIPWTAKRIAPPALPHYPIVTGVFGDADLAVSLLRS
jgi:glyoxylase-like metal-dependent hydrolase (beta-lactamase superfamily II)